jgi:hypothetical protein
MSAAGFLGSHRVLIVCGVVAISIVAVYAVHSADDPASEGKDGERQLLEQSGHVARALRGLNQSYAVAPVVTRHAFAGGSYYIDQRARVNGQRPNNGQPTNGKPGTPDDHGTTVQPPPPLWLGGRCDPLPGWLQGDLSWMYGEVKGPVHVDIPRLPGRIAPAAPAKRVPPGAKEAAPTAPPAPKVPAAGPKGTAAPAQQAAPRAPGEVDQLRQELQRLRDELRQLPSKGAAKGETSKRLAPKAPPPEA